MKLFWRKGPINESVVELNATKLEDFEKYNIIHVPISLTYKKQKIYEIVNSQMILSIPIIVCVWGGGGPKEWYPISNVVFDRWYFFGLAR